MNVTEPTPITPLSTRADRADERVRLIEESVLAIRGDWPAVAIGLCERVNRAVGLIVSTPGELDATIGKTCDEALRLVEDLYGQEAVQEVRRLAARDPQVHHGRRDRHSPRRPHLPWHRRRHAYRPAG